MLINFFIIINILLILAFVVAQCFLKLDRPKLMANFSVLLTVILVFYLCLIMIICVKSFIFKQYLNLILLPFIFIPFVSGLFSACFLIYSVSFCIYQKSVSIRISDRCFCSIGLPVRFAFTIHIMMHIGRGWGAWFWGCSEPRAFGFSRRAGVLTAARARGTRAAAARQSARRSAQRCRFRWGFPAPDPPRQAAVSQWSAPPAAAAPAAR